MSLLHSALCKSIGFGRSINIARFSLSPCISKQSLEEKLGIQAKPKKPMTPFLRFVNSIRPELLKQQPDIKVTEIAKIASERWKKVDPKTLNDLKQEYERDLEKYHKDIKEYDLKLSPELKEKLLYEKANLKLRKEKNDLKKKRESLGCPKKPPTTFLIFMKEKLSQRGDRSYSEWISNLGKMWKDLSEEQKAPYIELQKKELEEYKKKKAKWEKQMELKGLDLAFKKW